MSAPAKPPPFKWVHAPSDMDRDRIRILNGWPQLNITSFACEPLGRWTDQRSRIVTLNHSVKEDFLKLWERWEKEGLLQAVEDAGFTPRWSGGWVARYKRGAPHDQNPRNLSNHSSGHAFDILAPELPLGLKVPQNSIIRQLVPIALECGWHWGGDWGRADPQHFQHKTSFFP